MVEDKSMRKKIIIGAIIAGAFIGGYSINSIAVSNTNPDYKVAVVDIAEVIANSAEIKTIKAEQEKQVLAMQSTIDKARQDITKEKDPAKIAQLEEKYRKQINDQKLALDTEYNKKLTAIDSKIKTAVVEKARSMNYNIVLPKNTVLFGGDDITDQVVSIMK